MLPEGIALPRVQHTDKQTNKTGLIIVMLFVPAFRSYLQRASTTYSMQIHINY